MKAETYRKIRELPRMTVGQLRELYEEVFGECTRSYNNVFLRKRIGWRLQALDEGGLSERARRRAAELANDADLRIRPPRNGSSAEIAETESEVVVSHHRPKPRDPRLPQPGALLVRSYNDREIVVKVLEKGFEYENQRYKSLSAVAHAVTGNKWNGYVFFGL